MDNDGDNNDNNGWPAQLLFAVVVVVVVLGESSRETRISAAKNCILFSSSRISTQS